MAKVKAVTDAQGRVHMLDDAGSPVTVDAGEVSQALQAGFRIEGAETVQARQVQKERGTIGEMAKTAVEGAARGATLGLSDVATTSLMGDDYRQAALERQQANPLLSTGSEIAGAIAPIAFSGGTSAAAKGVSLLGTPARAAAGVGRAAEGATMAAAKALGYTGESIAGRVLARSAALGAAGAAEGTIYGAGKALSDAALTDQELTAEKLVAAMEDGLQLGAVAGAGFGALGGLTSGVAKKLSGGRASKSLAETASEFRDESVLKSFGAKRRDFKDLTGRKVGAAAETRWREVAEEAFTYELKSGPNQGQRLFKAARSADDMADDVERAVTESGDELRAMKQQLDQAGATPDMRGWLKRVDDEVIAPLRKSELKEERAQGAKLASTLADVKERVTKGQVVSKTVDDPVRPGAKRVVQEVVPGEYTFLEADSLRRRLRGIFQPPKPRGGGIPAPPPAHAEHLERAERMLAEHIGEAGERALRETGADPALWKQANKRVSNLLDLQQIVQRNLNDVGNRFTSPTDHAMGIASFLGAMATGNVGALTAMAAGGATAVANKLLRERGRSVMAELADRVSKMSTTVDTHAKALAGVLEKPKRALPAVTSNVAELRERYDSIAGQLREVAANPEAAQQVLAARTEPFAAEYPGLAQRVNAITMRQITYLSSKLPPSLSRSGASLTPLSEKAYTPSAQIRKFMRYEKGTLRPREVIEDITDGKFDRESIEALEVVHPELFQELRTKVATEVAQQGEALGYRQRIFLSTVFKFTGDRSLQPEHLRAIQESLGTVNTETQEPPGPEPAPALNPKLADEYATPAQQAASG